MRIVGLFRELGRGVSSFVPSIHDKIGQLDDVTAKKVVEYLRSGLGVYDVMESTPDPLDGTIFIPGGPSLVTDGEWVWREDLSYYVQKYKIGLSTEFLLHALEASRVDCSSLSPDRLWKPALDAYVLAEAGMAD